MSSCGLPSTGELFLLYWRECSRGRATKWAGGWGWCHTWRGWGSWASPACKREGRLSREAGGLFHYLMGGRRQYPARLFSEVHSQGRRQQSQAAGREIPAGQKEKIIFPGREIRRENELPREVVGSPTWRCSELDWPRP